MSVQNPPVAVPAFLQYALFFGLLSCGAVSLFHLGEFSPVPVTWFLDAWVAALAMAAVWHLVTPGGKISWRGAALALLAAYAFSLVASVALSETAWTDFLQAYRWLFYLVVICAIVGMRWTRSGLILVLTWWLVSLATLKSALTVLVYGAQQRPGLFLENNFELALFSGLAAVVYEDAGRSRLPLVALLGLLTVLSGSRSGAIVYIALVVYAIVRANLGDVFLRYLSAMTPIIAAVVSFTIFQRRAEESQVIDRVRFFGLFTQETERWGPLQWMTGTPPMTPLSAEVCQELEYYEALFSTQHEGVCYSVVLHAFAMRILYDAGILGLLLVICLPVLAMRSSRVPWPLVLTLMAITVANSLSVSGLNNPYVALPIILAILNGRPPPSPQRPAPPPDRAHLTVPSGTPDRNETS